MDGKLQELTETLFQEGVQKGEARALAIVAEAETKARTLLAQAKAEADRLLTQAKTDSEDFKTRTESEIRLAALQAVSVVKQTIQEAVTAGAVDGKTTAALSDTALVKDAIKTLVAKWDPQGDAPALEVLLPEDKRAELEKAFQSDMGAVLAKGLALKFSKDIKAGFQVAPKDGGFKVSFTDADFSDFFKQYLKPRTRRFLFNE